MAEWDDEKKLNLIQEYRQKPIIWDCKNKDYYKKHAWEEIGAPMGKSANECKKMIIILSSWRREKLKEKKTMGTGKVRDEIYESRWFAYSALDFLKDRDVPNKGLTTKNNTTSEKEEREAMEVEPQPKKSKVDPKLEMLKEAFGSLKFSAEKPQRNRENDYPELRSFCEFIFEKMKIFNKNLINSVQQEILQTIFRADQANANYSTVNYQQAVQEPTLSFTAAVNYNTIHSSYPDTPRAPMSTSSVNEHSSSHYISPSPQNHDVDYNTVHCKYPDTPRTPMSSSFSVNVHSSPHYISPSPSPQNNTDDIEYLV